MEVLPVILQIGFSRSRTSTTFGKSLHLACVSCPLDRQPRELPGFFAIAAVGGITAEATSPAVGMTG